MPCLFQLQETTCSTGAGRGHWTLALVLLLTLGNTSHIGLKVPLCDRVSESKLKPILLLVFLFIHCYFFVMTCNNGKHGGHSPGIDS